MSSSTTKAEIRREITQLSSGLGYRLEINDYAETSGYLGRVRAYHGKLQRSNNSEVGTFQGKLEMSHSPRLSERTVRQEILLQGRDELLTEYEALLDREKAKEEAFWDAAFATIRNKRTRVSELSKALPDEDVDASAVVQALLLASHGHTQDLLKTRKFIDLSAPAPTLQEIDTTSYLEAIRGTRYAKVWGLDTFESVLKASGGITEASAESEDAE